MKVENMNGKIFEVNLTGKGIEPISVGELLVQPTRYFIGIFDDLSNNRTTQNLNLIYWSENQEDRDLVHCWIREAVYYDAEVISIPKRTYTKENREILLPDSIEKSEFELRV